MLLIWDIHINHTHKDNIISSILSFVEKNSDENNIVFLGDYIYHFSYDRKALLELYQLFIDLYSRWKNIYVLAWNHDWISETFVYFEAQKLINIFDNNWKNKILFITEPTFEKIDWKEILFFPYNINIQADKNIDYENMISVLFQELSNSSNKNEIISANINKYLYDKIIQFQKSNEKDLLVIHHYYIEWTIFPWEKARFKYKDVALSNFFLDMKNIKLISWHLHQWFTYKNYFCTWSIWNVSPLEVNQFKFLYKFDGESISAKNISLNSYFQINYDELEENIILTQDFLSEYLKSLYQENISNFVSEKFNYNFWDFEVWKLNNMNIFLNSENLNYDNLKDVFEEKLFLGIKDIKIKKNYGKNIDLLNKLDLSKKDLEKSLMDWKTLLKEYIKLRHWERSELYYDKLKELKIL